MESEPFQALRINLHTKNGVESYMIPDAGMSMIIEGFKAQLCEMVTWLDVERKQIWTLQKEGAVVVMDNMSTLSVYVPNGLFFNESNPLNIDAYIVL